MSRNPLVVASQTDAASAIKPPITDVAVVLITITNAYHICRALGPDRWRNAFLAFGRCALIITNGGRSTEFSWNTVCLTFDATDADGLKAKLKLLSEIRHDASSDAIDAHQFELIARGAVGDDELEALNRAEQALADAKSQMHRASLRLDQAPRHQIASVVTSDFARAVANDEFYLVYQPKINVRQREVSSAEALIRWQHPELGLVMPDAFINLADAAGKMRAITLWTLDRVIADQQRLTSIGHPLRIFINISGGLLTDPIFIDAACARIESAEAKIGFEITETAVIRDPDLAIENLERCAAKGISLAIDDYGSGLSSLSYLKRLPATELKIDKMFITQLTSSHRDPLIVRSTIDLAHALDMEVTAEGVETPAALALLTVMGCEMVQGYLISPPLELPTFETYLGEYKYEALQTGAVPTVHRPASFWQRA